jgi:peroxiredoxin
MNAAPAASIEEAFRHAMELDAPLDARLGVIRDAYRRLHGDTAEVADRLVARLQQVAAGQLAPQPGESMPPFLLPDEAGRLVSLEGLLTEGPVAVVFHRGHWCPYCRLTAAALQEAEADIAASGGRIVAITPERRGYAARLKAASGASFPVLADLDNGYALSLNLAICMGAELQARMEALGRDLSTYQGNSAWVVPVPATFVVRPDGIIADRHVDPDYRRRMDIGWLVAAMRRAAAGGQASA